MDNGMTDTIEPFRIDIPQAQLGDAKATAVLSRS
jgi:hypothetical protein